jgi:hypothetical protein
LTTDTDTAVVASLQAVTEFSDAFTGAAAPFAGVGVKPAPLTPQQLALQNFSGAQATRSAQSTYVQARAQAMLDGAPGVNFTGRLDAVRYRTNVAGGRANAGTALTDFEAIESVVGPLPRTGSRITISTQQATMLERNLGLPTGRVQGGGVLSIVNDVGVRAPRSPIGGNSLFLGGGRGLPGGGPEINIAPINTAGGGGVRQIIVEVR